MTSCPPPLDRNQRRTFSLLNNAPFHLRDIFSIAREWIIAQRDFAEDRLPLRQGRDGVWRIQLDLETGRRYEFRYLIDGHWQTDYMAPSQDNQVHVVNFRVRVIY